MVPNYRWGSVRWWAPGDYASVSGRIACPSTTIASAAEAVGSFLGSRIPRVILAMTSPIQQCSFLPRPHHVNALRPPLGRRLRVDIRISPPHCEWPFPRMRSPLLLRERPSPVVQNLPPRPAVPVSWAGSVQLRTKHRKRRQNTGSGDKTQEEETPGMWTE